MYDSRFSEIANISFPLFDIPKKKKGFITSRRGTGGWRRIGLDVTPRRRSTGGGAPAGNAKEKDAAATEGGSERDTETERETERSRKRYDADDEGRHDAGLEHAC